MYARAGMTTPAHAHRKKKEDIICRSGLLAMKVWTEHPESAGGKPARVSVNREWHEVESGRVIELPAGWRVTLTPGIYHEFWPLSPECIIGEVSTANDDLHDNFFVNEKVGRFPGIEEDEPALVRLVSEEAS
jgi:D-lyxose ketol-isomerase